MQIVRVITPYGVQKGFYNVKAGLVSYCIAGVALYVSAEMILPALLVKQAF